MATLLECRGLEKRFGDRLAVDGITFSIDTGEVFGLLGPNGAGKTTTVKMVCGLLEPDAGRVLIDRQHRAPAGHPVGLRRRIRSSRCDALSSPGGDPLRGASWDSWPST
ncbi:MAG TPA: ATP-binding cassette domain-containing protein [Acidimicrobiales bacterium]|nr:ATP-binding cassette domain-containing protein [Acidimicrobiales bacterium]